MLTSLAPSPIASVIAPSTFCLTSWTICDFCKGDTLLGNEWKDQIENLSIRVWRPKIFLFLTCCLRVSSTPDPKNSLTFPLSFQNNILCLLQSCQNFGNIISLKNFIKCRILGLWFNISYKFPELSLISTVFSKFPGFSLTSWTHFGILTYAFQGFWGFPAEHLLQQST